MTTLTLLNFSRHVSAIASLRYRRNLSRTFIRHDCHRQKVQVNADEEILSQSLHTPS